jgi:hypothetical protein
MFSSFNYSIQSQRNITCRSELKLLKTICESLPSCDPDYEREEVGLRWIDNKMHFNDFMISKFTILVNFNATVASSTKKTVSNKIK